MGGSDSEPAADNKGVLNGNIINNGKIIEAIETDISSENFLLKIVIALKTIHILIVLIKMFVKFIKSKENQKRRIEEIALQSHRS